MLFSFWNRIENIECYNLTIGTPDMSRVTCELRFEVGILCSGGHMGGSLRRAQAFGCFYLRAQWSDLDIFFIKISKRFNLYAGNFFGIFGSRWSFDSERFRPKRFYFQRYLELFWAVLFMVQSSRTKMNIHQNDLFSPKAQKNLIHQNDHPPKWLTGKNETDVGRPTMILSLSRDY